MGKSIIPVIKITQELNLNNFLCFCFRNAWDLKTQSS